MHRHLDSSPIGAEPAGEGHRFCFHAKAEVKDAEWESLRLEPERFIDAAEQVVIPLQIAARGKRTGTPAAFMITTLAEVQGGMIVRVRNYTSQAEALEAAGLRK